MASVLRRLTKGKKKKESNSSSAPIPVPVPVPASIPVPKPPSHPRGVLVYRRRRESGFEDRIYIMYHGTDDSNVDPILSNGFKLSDNGMLGRGIYVSEDINKTLSYGNVTFKLLVYMGKTKKITSQNQSNRTTWQQEANSAWVPQGCGMVKSERSENCIRDSKQIRILGICRGWDELDTATQDKIRDRTNTTLPLDDKEKDLLEDLKRKYILP